MIRDDEHDCVNSLGKKTNVFLHGHTILAVVANALGGPGRRNKVTKSAKTLLTALGHLLLSHVNHQHFLTAINQFASENSANGPGSDDKDIRCVDFLGIFPQKLYVLPEALFWRERNARITKELSRRRHG